eukprot:scaffold3813_cov31-Tisochrysis_lutea.AAC.2
MQAQSGHSKWWIVRRRGHKKARIRRRSCHRRRTLSGSPLASTEDGRPQPVRAAPTGLLEVTAKYCPMGSASRTAAWAARLSLTAIWLLVISPTQMIRIHSQKYDPRCKTPKPKRDMWRAPVRSLLKSYQRTRHPRDLVFEPHLQRHFVL